VKEDIVLTQRPARDEILFSFHMQRLSPARDGKGGYVLYDSYSHPRFHILAPTVEDANGRSGKATLELTRTEAIIRIDAAFLSTAAYPITVDPTVNWTTGNFGTTFEYDRYAPVSQLTEVTAAPSESDYTYDLARNRTQRLQGPSGSHDDTDYTYDRADRILTSAGVGYTVNANGNLRERSHTTSPTA
jgi:hypothetical protein